MAQIFPQQPNSATANKIRGSAVNHLRQATIPTLPPMTSAATAATPKAAEPRESPSHHTGVLYQDPTTETLYHLEGATVASPSVKPHLAVVGEIWLPTPASPNPSQNLR
ncbi:hypothetical protein ISN44_As10g010830 [Arabidopsis suecica]|uniref:Uncharacterized protein n=1 Tax=Arabidopsis suecica TaxID=45249 RepID=A0A8T1ZUA5_ARASU|nr:hypothetical protein ISN44_As10g010830 [Arabidopsis suecica]